MPNLDGVVLTDALRRKVFERYYDLLKKVFGVPLWTSYYNTQIVKWLYATQPKFARAGKPAPSAAGVVRYLLRAYAAGGRGFLFGETRRADFVRALETHRPANYLFAYVAAALNSRPPPEECRAGLWEDVAAAVADCLRRPECWKHVENAFLAECIPPPLRDRYDREFLADLRTRFEKSQQPLEEKIRRLENAFFSQSSGEGAAYLTAAVPPLAFLDPHNALGGVSRTFKSKVKRGVFPVENLFLASLSHLWPEWVVGRDRLSEAGRDRLFGQARAAVRGETGRLLGRPPEEHQWGLSPEGKASLEVLDELCRTRDLSQAVLYYTGGEFVCFRESEVLRDIAKGDVRKYPRGLVEKMKARRAALPSPVLYGPQTRPSKKKGAAYGKERGDDDYGKESGDEDYGKESGDDSDDRLGDEEMDYGDLSSEDIW